ncbi:MAG: neutral amino acid transporter [Alectoria sarmentosa]|nr:MAG: neutral amino acid transporter [Alectoria sarmentosa]
MSGQRNISSPSRPRPVPSSSSNGAPRGRSPAEESTPRATSIARLASPVASLAAQSSPPIRQVSTPSHLNSESHTPLAGTGPSQSIPGPGHSALAAALQGSFGRSPPRFGTPPLQPLSPSTAGAALQGSGPQTTYGSFDSRSGQGGQRRISGAPNEDPKVVKRHLVQPPNLDGINDNGEGSSTLSHRASSVNVGNDNGENTATGIGDDEFSSLRLQGGDMTRTIYRWAENAEAPGRGKRSKSWHISRLEPEDEEFNASAIKQPGGFRRNYLRRQAPDQSSGQRGGPMGLESQKAFPPNGQPMKTFTNSFYEFLTIYGHFAGEELKEDDEDEYFNYEPCIDERGGEEGEGESGEESALFTPGTPGIRKRKVKDRGAKGKNSSTGAALLLLKSFIGTGVLFLPKAYLNGGMMFSNVVLLGVASLSYYCFILLVNTRLKVEGSFGDMGGILYGKWMRALILTSVALSQMGFVSAYIVFTAESMQAFVLAVSKCRTWIDIKFMVLMQLVIFLPLSLIRDISKLGLTAIIADVFIALGLLYLGYFDIHTMAKYGVADITNFNPRDWTLFIGTAIFTFEGVGLIIPIQESMTNPSKFPPVLAGVMIFITILFIFMGAVSYAAFGSATKTVVLLNLPQDSQFVNAIQLLYSLAILLSTPLQLFPAIRIMENEIFSRSGKNNRYIKWKKNLFRFFLVMVCALIAWGGAGDLDKFVALVGSFACVPLVYVYPAMLHFKAVADSKRKRIADVILCVFGGVVMVYTTALTIKSWANGSSSKPPGYCDE